MYDSMYRACTKVISIAFTIHEVASFPIGLSPRTMQDLDSV